MTQEVQASEHIRADRNLPDNARILADVVLRALASESPISVSFVGVRGISSAFANPFLAHLAETGVDVRAQVHFEYETRTQERVLERSLADLGAA